MSGADLTELRDRASALQTELDAVLRQIEQAEVDARNDERRRLFAQAGRAGRVRIIEPQKTP